MTLPAVLRLPVDANARYHSMVARVGAFASIGYVTAWPVVSFIRGADFQMMGMSFLIGGITLLAPMLFGLPIPEVVDNPTRALPKGMSPLSIRSALWRLHEASQRGLLPNERLSTQRMIDDAVAQMRHLLDGQEPWIAAGMDMAKTDTRHLAVRGDVLWKSCSGLCKAAESPHGSNRLFMAAEINRIVPLMGSIAQDFGLDATGLVPTTARVAGQRLDHPVELPMLSAPLRRLAEEWSSKPNEGVDVLVRIEADGAAGKDLRALEAAWGAARDSASPEEVDAIDAKYMAGAERLCATLSQAIADRSKRNFDQLETTTRYIEQKHAA
jgi:hypothetical protein